MNRHKMSWKQQYNLINTVVPNWKNSFQTRDVHRVLCQNGMIWHCVLPYIPLRTFPPKVFVPLPYLLLFLQSPNVFLGWGVVLVGYFQLCCSTKIIALRSGLAGKP